MSLNKVNKQTGETSIVAGLGGSSGGHTIQNESGTDLTQRDTMQFTGQAKATDDSTNGKTIIDVSPEVVDWDDWRQMTDQEKEAIPEAMIENAPGIDGLLSATLLTKLWENPDPTAAFAAQNITLSESATNYDSLLIEYIFTLASPVTTYVMGNSITGTSLNYASPSSSGAQSRARDANYINATTLSFSDGYIASGTTRAANNDICVPVAVYGFKKSINLEFSAIASDVSTSADKCMLSDGTTSVGDIIDKGSVSVTADGVKTWSQLFNELFALIDTSKVSVNSKLAWITSSNTLTFVIRDFNSTRIRMNLSFVDTNSATLDTIAISTSSVWNRCNLSTSISYVSRNDGVPTNGDLLTFYY